MQANAVGQLKCDINGLLETAGARPRGNRHDCPKCGGQRTLTHTAECFFCHKCAWKGSVITLEKELGIYRRLPSAEYRELSESRQRADRAARELYGRVKARRFELLEELHSLSRLETHAHHAMPDDPNTWDILSRVYSARPGVLAELAILENSSAAEIARFLVAGPAEKNAALECVLYAGGLRDSSGRFVEVSP